MTLREHIVCVITLLAMLVWLCSGCALLKRGQRKKIGDIAERTCQEQMQTTAFQSAVTAVVDSRLTSADVREDFRSLAAKGVDDALLEAMKTYGGWGGGAGAAALLYFLRQRLFPKETTT